jgi:hypothetical protein
MKKFTITYSNIYLGQFSKVYDCKSYKDAQTKSLIEIGYFREMFNDWFSVEFIKEIPF